MAWQPKVRLSDPSDSTWQSLLPASCWTQGPGVAWFCEDTDARGLSLQGRDGCLEHLGCWPRYRTPEGAPGLGMGWGSGYEAANRRFSSSWASLEGKECARMSQRKLKAHLVKICFCRT